MKDRKFSLEDGMNELLVVGNVENEEKLQNLVRVIP
jgi:hypothetical protein